MNIYFEEKNGTFHLQNRWFSYIMKILPNGQPGQLYFGKTVRHRASFDYLFEKASRVFSPSVDEEDPQFSMEQARQEFPSAGAGDFRQPAVTVLQQNGSRISGFAYEGHQILPGKPALEGLPATYTENDAEAQTLQIHLLDTLTGVRATLFYTVFEDYPALARSVRFENGGGQAVWLDTAMSLSLDLPDAEYQMLQLSGAWCRERFVHASPLPIGVQSIGSQRGTSSHHNNPFLVLKRPHTGERQGEAIGFSLVYSGNFLAQAEVDNWGVTRVSMGIDPDTFCWKLEPGEFFQTPEAVMVYTQNGLNAMSQAYHSLYGKRLARGYWRDRARPVLINNWEVTEWNFTQEQILQIASVAAEAGIELFVLDDGWSRNRCSDRAGLGDWYPCEKKLPEGIRGLSEKIRQTGLSFGLWFEPEMVNRDSDLYRSHPDWVLRTPGRRMSPGRNEYVLDFSRPEVVDHIYARMEAVIREGNVSYVKWDMNRSITEAYSAALPPDRQGEVFHRYILGVYTLYERLIRTFPQVLFESCASGGGRFDPGMLYYAPQGWASDCSDAAQRIRIQYGTSMCYPISSIGAHVSASPNIQLNRSTPLSTRANVACFGTFGYEMDITVLSAEEMKAVKDQVAFMKRYRHLLQFGTFYRLLSPFESGFASWMVVSPDRRTAIVGWYKYLNEVNGPFRRIRLEGLDPDLDYRVREGMTPGEDRDSIASIFSEKEISPGIGKKGERRKVQTMAPDNKEAVGTACLEMIRGGDELMQIGLITTDSSAGECRPGQTPSCDFDSRLYILEATE